MRLRYTPRARAHLVAIRAYWLTRNRSHGARIEHQIHVCIEHLQSHPYIGHPGRDPETREINVPRLPFTIVYELLIGDATEAIILGVYPNAVPKRN